MEEYEVDLRDYIEVIWRRKWIILLVTILAVGIAAGYSIIQPNQYHTSGTYELISLQPETQALDPDIRSEDYNPVIYKLDNPIQPEKERIEVFSQKELIAILSSRNLAFNVVNNFSPDEFNWGNSSKDSIINWINNHLDAEVMDSNLIELSIGGSKKPEILRNTLVQLSNGANRVLLERIRDRIETIINQEEIYVEMLESERSGILTEIEDQISELKQDYQNKIDHLGEKLEEIRSNENYDFSKIQVGENTATMQGFKLREQYQSLNQRLTALQRDLDQLNINPDNFLPNLHRSLNQIEEEIDASERKIATLENMLNEYSSSNQVLVTIDPPYKPFSPQGPNRKMNIAVAGVLGIFLGTLLGFFVEYMSHPREEEQ